jgi:hypothetical protein
MGEASNQLFFFHQWKERGYHRRASDPFKPHAFPDQDVSEKLTRAGLGILMRIDEFYPLVVGPEGMIDEPEKFSS